MRNLFLLLISLCLVLFLSQKANAEAILFDFNSGPGENFTVLNTGGIWNMDLDGPTLRILKPADDGSLNNQDGFIFGEISSNFYLRGDFVATVEFSLYNFSSTPDSSKYNESIFAFGRDGGYLFEILRLRAGTNNKIEAFSVNSGQVIVKQENSALNNGIYKITRTGTTMTAQYAPIGSDDFVIIATLAGFTDGDLKLYLEAAQGRAPHRSLAAMDIDFDNLYIEADSIVGLSNPIPEPTTMFLLGSGLIGIAGFRKKFQIRSDT